MAGDFGDETSGLLLDDPVFGFPGGSLFPVPAVDDAADNVSVDGGGPLMSDTSVQGSAKGDDSRSTTTGTLSNGSSSPSPRPQLRKIAPKPAENPSLALRVQAGVRKPTTRTKRSAFKIASVRAETSLTRTLNSCVRCRFLRNRVSDVNKACSPVLIRIHSALLTHMTLMGRALPV